jgi:hypothetical protein
MQTMRSFATETMTEITAAIDAHETEQEAVVAGKNDTGGETSSVATSPSVG